MTLTAVPPEYLPTTASFLGLICPGRSSLDENVEYILPEDKTEVIDWPIGPYKTAHLDHQYLNIARPPFGSVSNESNSYVALPYHIHSLFEKVVDKEEKQRRGELHIGASVSSLAQDPFRFVELTPGCISSILDLLLGKYRSSTSSSGSKNPFSMLTNNFNKFLKLSSLELGYSESFQPLWGVNGRLLAPIKVHFIEKVLNYNPDTYPNEYQSAIKLLISVNINVLNVLALNEESNLPITREITGDWLTFVEPNNLTSAHHKKVIGECMLRIQFKHNMIVTCMKSFVNRNEESLVVLGFDCGEIVVIDLAKLTYKDFSEFTTHGINKASVTSITIVGDSRYDWLIWAGFSNGEIAILSPYEDNKDDKKSKYEKRVVGKDSFITYFKKFDLSLFRKASTNGENRDNRSIVGHFKISEHPITAIESTLPLESCAKGLAESMILAIGSLDGFVKFIDLLASINCEYGLVDDPLNKSLVTDVISTYFSDGIQDLSFSNDYKLLAVCGRGDLIEIFKLNYYSVSGIVAKNNSSNAGVSLGNGAALRRPHSGSITSSTSHGPYSANIYNSIASDLPEDTTFYPMILKEIRIMARLKSHVNTVNKVSFFNVENDNDYQSKGSDFQTYKLISCGCDGRIIMWDLDYKAIPKVTIPQTNKKKNSLSPVQTHLKRPSFGPVTSPGSLGFSSLREVNKPTNYSRPITLGEEFGGNLNQLTKSGSRVGNSGGMTINSVLNTIKNYSSNDRDLKTRDDHGSGGMEREKEREKAISSLYKTLFELRLRKQFHNTGRRFEAVIQPIISDTLVPSINVPLLSLDLSKFVRDGKISNYYFDSNRFWCFAKSGDIFRFQLK